MINKIGLGDVVGSAAGTVNGGNNTEAQKSNNVKFISFRAENSSEPVQGNLDATNEVKQEESTAGLEALAAYNQAIIKKTPITKDKLFVEPLEPIIINPEDVEKMEGERIYSSDGKLNSIIRRDENTYTVFIPSEDNENMFSKITTFEKGNDKYPLKEQQNEIRDGKYADTRIVEYNPNTGEELRSSIYYDNQLYKSEKNLVNQNGQTANVSYYNDNNEYNVIVKDDKTQTETYVNFDKNKQISLISERKGGEYDNKEFSMQFYNGAPISLEVSKRMTIPNTIAWNEVFKNDELRPAEHFNKIENLKEIEGEKTYYSNGALESNTFNSDNGKTTAYFSPDGSCYKIDSDSLSVTYDGTREIITEKDADGKVKETSLYKDGDKTVSIKDGENEKFYRIKSNGKPECYSETIYKDGNEESYKSFSFNDKSMLASAYEY